MLGKQAPASPASAGAEVCGTESGVLAAVETAPFALAADAGTSTAWLLIESASCCSALFLALLLRFLAFFDAFGGSSAGSAPGGSRAVLKAAFGGPCRLLLADPPAAQVRTEQIERCRFGPEHAMHFSYLSQVHSRQRCRS